MQHLTEPFSIVAWSVVFYGSHPLIIALAVLPSAVRAYQMYTGRLTLGLEMIVELARVVLFLAIIVTGRKLAVDTSLTGDAWGTMIGDVLAFIGANWFQALIEYGVLLLIFAAVNRIIGLLVNQRTVGAVLAKVGTDLRVPAATKATLFAIKNMLVIPLFVIGMFRILHLI